MRLFPPAEGAACVLVLLFGHAPAGQSTEAGAILGHIKLTRRVRGVPLPANAYQPRTVNRRETDAVPEIQNVVVYLKDPPFREHLAPMRKEIRQVNETFSPRVVAVTRGSTVAFPNSDPFFHNVFSLSGNATF